MKMRFFNGYCLCVLMTQSKMKPYKEIWGQPQKNQIYKSDLIKKGTKVVLFQKF